MTSELKSERIETAPGIKLHVLRQGKGPRILFLHGFPSYGGSWKPYFQKLSGSFELIAPDLRGYNLSSQPPDVDAYRLESLLDDVVSLARKLGPEPICLVGHDWGGILAWYLAGHYPQIFSRLIIINAPHPKIYQQLFKSDWKQKLKAYYIPILLTADSEKFLALGDYRAVKLLVFGMAKNAFTPEERREHLEAWRHGLRGPVNYYRSYVARQRKLVAGLPNIKVPTLVLWGEKDQALSLKNIEGLDAYVSDLEIVRYPDATHWITHEKVDSLASKIASFCREADGAASNQGAALLR